MPSLSSTRGIRLWVRQCKVESKTPAAAFEVLQGAPGWTVTSQNCYIYVYARILGLVFVRVRLGVFVAFGLCMFFRNAAR